MSADFYGATTRLLKMALFKVPFRFGDYSFVPETGELISADNRVILTKKDSEVLDCLLRHGNELVNKEVIYKSVWENTVVSETVLRACIKRLRKTLGDDHQFPTYIETMKGRGYRLLPSIERLPSVHKHCKSACNNDLLRAGIRVKDELPAIPSPVPFVGRKQALEVLEKNLTEVLNGKARTVFVSGKAGMGKTELIKRFVSSISGLDKVNVITGQGFKIAESRDAYSPIS
ncbi:winged helix-turn-helix domain-containing protein [Desulfofustis limnaeus]|nr:winged helix-turn-helix domain-containing protein [Desulfofustis limnaeus]